MLVIYTKTMDNKLSEEETNRKREYACGKRKNLFEEQVIKGANMHVKNTENFVNKKKTKTVNIHVNSIEIFLKTSK